MNKKNTLDRKRVLFYLKPFKKLMLLSLLLTITVVIFDGLSLWFSGSLVNAIFGPELTTPPEPVYSLKNASEVLNYWSWRLLTIRSNSRSTVLATICIIIPILFALKDIFLYLQKVTIDILNLKIVQFMRNHFYKHILNLPMSYYDSSKSGNLVSYIVRDMDVISNALTNSLNHIIMEPLKLIFFISLLCILNLRLTLIVFTLYPLLAIVISVTGKAIKRRGKRMLNSFSDVISVVSESVSGARVIKMLSGHQYEQRKFENSNMRFTDLSIREKRVKHILHPFSEFLSMTLTSALLWYGGMDIFNETSSFSSEDFLRFLIILFGAYAPMKQLMKVTSNLQAGFAASDRIFEILDLNGEEDLTDRDIDSFNHSIEIKDLSFAYPGYTEQVLHNINLTIKKGEMIAFVGSSGAGKSTILDLLPRFYDNYSGEICFDNTSNKDFSLESLRSLFGIVAQDTILFNDTVIANIAYAEEDPDIEKVKSSLKAANALNFVEELSEGLYTTIGERGVTLSGGQRQRLAIARAIYKNPEILILDEATSALDTESEKLVQDAIMNLVKDRTTLVVAHRLSTIRNADRIVVLEKGRVVEVGTHEELIEVNGRYRKLHTIQFGE